MEASMGKEEMQVRKDLDDLTTLVKPLGDVDLAAALSQFARYREVKAHILALSRENTNVRSMTLSLSQKRKAMALCLDSLNALKIAILDEPIAGVTYGRVPKPR
jgi:ABC-type multidrug transport system ATPase subunit